MIGAKIGLSQFGPGAIFAQPMQSGRYYFAPNLTTTTTSAALGTGTLRVTPLWIPNTLTIQRIGADVATIGDVGSKFRLGVYADDGTGRPGSLLLDAGQIAGDSATVQEVTGLSLTLSPGVYWIGGVVQSVSSTQPTMRTPGGGYLPNIDNGTTIPLAASVAVGFTMTGVTAALPATFTVAAVAGVVPRIFFKVN